MTQDSKRRKIGFWITTILVALNMGVGGALDAIALPEAVVIFDSLGYPKYLIHFIGVAKVLAAITIVLPKFPRLKEWAYAGIAIDLVGASYSHLMSGDGAADVILPLVVLALALASWWLRPADRKLPDAR